MSKNLLLVTGIFPPDIGGPATYVPKLAEFLKNKGHKVQVLTLGSQWKYKRNADFTLVVIPRSYPKFIRIPITALLIRLLSFQTDAIFANGLFEEVYLSGSLRKKISVAKVVGDPIWERYRNSRTNGIGIEGFQTLALPLRLQIQRKLLTAALNHFSAITSPGKQLKEIVQSWLISTNVTVIPNGVSCEKIMSETKEWDLLTVSRLVSWKNIDFVLRSVGDENLRIGIIGAGPEERTLKNIAKGAAAQINFLGEIEGSQVPNFISKSKIFVQMSEYEGMSFALLQAMMQGVAIVTSDASGNTNVIENGETGLVVKLGESELFNKVIKTLINDGGLRCEIGKKARNQALANYCQEKQLGKMGSLLGL
ncbi:glycosyltransferase [Candidatus Planktophila versatilis]|uniref:glycosyltransferase family 4 protein n=1 Tax=Candidatus Planktophila versatilis TaxID=1884905 RepID=UPI000BAC7AC7|nr:glycosyltransferase family 4 protein [Candidatus Planktophila versatilis]ASY18023.1 glycosyltransferase [Candidatus Planktophila versatilis]